MRKQILLMCDDFSFCRRFQETMQDDTTTIQYFLTVADALDSYTGSDTAWLLWIAAWRMWTVKNCSK